MSKKKTINDMPQAWFAEHRASQGVSENDFCRHIGVLSPAASEADVKAAQKSIDETHIVLDLVKDLMEGSQILSASSKLVVEQEMLRRVYPHFKKAYEEMCKASKIIQGIDPDEDEDAMPKDEDDEEMA
jgi:hypothetical protein